MHQLEAPVPIEARSLPTCQHNAKQRHPGVRDRRMQTDSARDTRNESERTKRARERERESKRERDREREK